MVWIWYIWSKFSAYGLSLIVHGLDTRPQGNFPQFSQISRNHPPIPFRHIIRITSIRWSGHCQQVGCKRLQRFIFILFYNNL